MAARRRRARAGPVVAPGFLLRRLHPRSAGPGGPPPFFANAQVSRRTRRWEARVRRETCAFAGMCPSVRWRFPQSSPRRRRAGGAMVRKGGSRVSFTPHSTTARSRNGGMTPFLERPDPPRALKSTQEPPFPPRRRAGDDSRCMEYPGEVLSGSAAESVGERVHPGRARGSR